MVQPGIEIMRSLALILLSFCITLSPIAAEPEGAAAKASQGRILSDTNVFPIAVWLQHPKNAERYKAAGINLYVGLWKGPTEEQLDTLEKAGMPVICSQNEVGLANLDNPIIAAWMHGDEPDNAQPRGDGKGYGPPIKPEVIQEGYAKIKANDRTRPVFLNLGQGVAWDNYIGRGVRRNKPEDYPEYIQGADIVSFDIYPVVHDHAEIAGKLEYVARGVERLVEWSEGRKTVWNCIECTHISNPERKASPAQIRSEVWMALIHGSRGIIYFVHQFEPTFREAALLDDPENLAAVTAINGQIQSLAPVLHSPNLADGESIQPVESSVRIASMTKRAEDGLYLFSVAMEERGGEVTFGSAALPREGTVEVLGEDRIVPIVKGQFKDHFDSYEAHLYRIRPAGR